MTKTILNKGFLIFITALVALSFLACDNAAASTTEIQNYNQGLESIVDENLYTLKMDNVLTDDDEDDVESELNDFKIENTATVLLNDDQTVITNNVEDTSIYMENGNLIVDSTKKLTLIISGTLNGSLIVYKSDGKLKLVLDNASIVSTSGPAINLQTEKRVFLILKENTINQLTDGTVHPKLARSSETNAALFSEEQLIISGTGELNVIGNYKHGICSDDYLKIISGQINIVSAVVDGLHANDYIAIDGGETSIDASSNGMEAEEGYIAINGGKISITSINAGIKTSYLDVYDNAQTFIEINNGIIYIDSDSDGISSVADITINGGALMVTAVSDAISSKKNINIYDGVIYSYSLEKQSLEGDDGITILGGVAILVSDGDGKSLESDHGTIRLNGGTIVNAGAVDLNLTNSLQGYLKCGNVSANTILSISNTSNLLTVGFISDYYHIVLSTPEMVKNEELNVYLGGNINGNNFYGLYYTGIYTQGTLKDTLIVQ